MMIVMTTVGTTLSACHSTSSTQPVTVIADKGTPYGDLLIPQLRASVRDDAVGVMINKPVTVQASSGVLGEVSLINGSGIEVQGRLSPDGISWSTTEALDYNKQYTLSAQSLGLGGITTETMTFTTQSPANLTMPMLLPASDDVIGVGQPIAVRFDENIPNRLAAQRAITVVTDPPVEGAFYWLNNREVRWRPEHYWTPGTTITVAVNTYGVDLGDGLFGMKNVTTRMTVGDEVIAIADDETKTLTVRRNGEIVRTMPLSMGKNSTPTDNGVYIIGDRFSHLVMDSSTYGVPTNSPDGYRIDVNYATQMSYSGIFVHSAPWSVGSQGRSNVSHGCLNVSPSDALWFFTNTKRGDIVKVVNTVGSTLSGVDGLGDWNIPWRQWKAGNANV